MKKKIVLVIGFILVMSPGLIHCIEFNLYDMGAKGGTFAGAFVARFDDASVIYYNPAGISFLKGVQFKLNTGLSSQTVTAERESFHHPIRSKSGLIPVSCYLSLNIMDRISFGLGFFMPHFFESEWEDTWEERFTCINSKFISYFIRPVLALKLNDRLSFGVGLDIIFSSMRWDHFFLLSYQDNSGNNIDYEILNTLDFKGHGFGFSMGFLFKVSDRLQFGGRYQNKKRIDYKGVYKFTTNTYRPDYPILDATSHIILPPEIVLGVMFSPIKKLSLELDLQWTGWSIIKSIEFIPEDIEEKTNKALYFTQSVLFDGKDVWTLKTGIEYFLSDSVSLRAGFSRYKSCQNILSPVFPSFSRSVFSIGIGFKGPAWADLQKDKHIGFLSFYLYLQFVLSNGRSYPFSSGPVFYDADNWALGIGVGWSSK
jgi:long-chain fatty acid transport protein